MVWRGGSWLELTLSWTVLTVVSCLLSPNGSFVCMLVVSLLSVAVRTGPSVLFVMLVLVLVLAVRIR